MTNETSAVPERNLVRRQRIFARACRNFVCLRRNFICRLRNLVEAWRPLGCNAAESQIRCPADVRHRANMAIAAEDILAFSGMAIVRLAYGADRVSRDGPLSAGHALILILLVFCPEMKGVGKNNVAHDPFGMIIRKIDRGINLEI